MCLNCIVHFPAGISRVAVRASHPGAVVLVKEEANEEGGLGGRERNLGEVRAPRDTPGSESKLLRPFFNHYFLSSLSSSVFLISV